MILHTVVETPFYLRKAEGLFTKEEMAGIVNVVAKDPEAGDVMEGTGGFRKFRVGRGSKGKRGGARVIYLYRNDRLPVFLVQVYAKNEMDNLSKAERNALKKRADDIFESYRG
ncbi:MAG: type II toxin-antitoxin system RelE/ParE family toxin [Acidobacteriaceae bacterium]|nr:type II toxin-antitoxin system RelE/ParE family toxin [Acidobacteriaceae bacterium]